MRVFGFVLGVLALLIALAFGIAEIVLSGPQGLGTLWFAIDANSLVGFQAIVEKQISPALWPPVQWLLTVPGWLLFLVPAVVLIFACRPRWQPG